MRTVLVDIFVKDNACVWKEYKKWTGTFLLVRLSIMISAHKMQETVFFTQSTYDTLFEPVHEDDKNNVIFVNAEHPNRFYTKASLRDRILKLGGLLRQKYRWQSGDILAICAENTASVTISAIYYSYLLFSILA